MPRLIRSAALNNYVELARSLGLDPYRMIAACDLPATCLDDPEIKVPVTSVIKLLEESALRSGKIDFGLRLAENRTLANLGALALLVREQPTIRKALDALAGYMFLHSEALRVRIVEQDDLVLVDFIIDTGRPVPMRQAVELGLGFLHRSFQRLFRERWNLRRFVLPTRRQAAPTCTAVSSVRRFGSIRISTVWSARRANSKSRCRRQMRQWRSRSSSISTRWRHARPQS